MQNAMTKISYMMAVSEIPELNSEVNFENAGNIKNSHENA